MLKLVFNILFSNRIASLKQSIEFYSNDNNFCKDKAEDIQVSNFNNIWKNAYTNIPFYKSWKEKHKLPDEIDHISQLKEFPILTKKIISDNRKQILNSPNSERETLTGGTSGISTPFPMNSDDANTAWVNTFTGRYLNGIKPRSKLLMIWGHSHLFNGKGAYFKHLKRYIADRLNRIYRTSAYDLSDKNLKFISHQIFKKKPEYIIGYGSCLVAFANYCLENNINFKDANIKRIVNTSETITQYDANKISRLFMAPVINEYGMAEAGVIGYSVSSLFPIKIFFKEFIVRVHNNKIIITTIGKKCFPLINYDTEDLSIEDDNDSLYEFSNLGGKERDIINFIDKNKKEFQISVIILDHIFKQVNSIRSLHYKTENNLLNIYFSYFGNRPSEESLFSVLQKGLALQGINIEFSNVKFHQLEEPIKTFAGKRKAVL